MAVAVKNTPETSTGSAFDRLPVVSLLGVVYLLSSLAIVFGLIPNLWGRMWSSLFEATNTFASGTLLGIVMLAAFTGLMVLGGNLLGPKAPAGTRAGIFTALVGLLVVVGLTRWFSVWVEHYCYYQLLFGSSGRTVGAVLTAIAGIGLLILFLRWFFKPGTEKGIGSFEDQGWFSTKTYKKNQGMKVRRGTIVGLLLLFGSGVFTLVNHKTLERGLANLDMYIPFTGKVWVTPESAGDALSILQKDYPSWVGAEGTTTKLGIDRYTLREINSQIDPETHVKINNVNEVPTDLQDGSIVTKSVFAKEQKKLEEEGLGGKLLSVPPTLATGEVTFDYIRLLPAVRYTVPLLLLGLIVWFAWRVVNLPTFADFLIATEAELNKVSWTTRKRLYQDTIVVLVTVFLMAGYLFAMDQVWARLLSWRPIGVIVFKQEDTGAKTADQKPW